MNQHKTALFSILCLISMLYSSTSAALNVGEKAATGTNPPHIQMADLNADGIPDRISTHVNGGLSVAIGIGNASFNAPINYLKGIKPLTVAVGDINGDDYLDISAIHTGTNTAYVLYGDGNAEFTAQTVGLDTLAVAPSEALITDNDANGFVQISPKQSVETAAKQKNLASKIGQALAVKAATLTTLLEQSAHEKINAYRAERGLPALVFNKKISNVARNHSKNMAAGRVPFGHKGFLTRARFLERSIPLQAASENVAFNKGFSDPAETAVNGWINSPEHLKNIVGKFNLTGIGVAKNKKDEYYFTQIFIRR